MKEEQRIFQDLAQNGRTVIIMNLYFNQSLKEVYPNKERSQRWLWIAKEYHFLLSYPHDVDVYSLGLLNASVGSQDIQISFENINGTCGLHFDTYLAQYLVKVTKGNETISDNINRAYQGHICYSKIIKLDNFMKFVGQYSGVKIGFPFWCYFQDQSTFQMVEKSDVIYIVIFLALFAYAFYPLLIEMVFFIEDRKKDGGFYFKSDSPYSPSVIGKQIIFSGNNKYFAALRIIIMLILSISLVYKLKSELYDSCNCSLELWTGIDWTIFPHAENFYGDTVHPYILGGLYFLLVHVCILFNSKGDLDDFIIINCLFLRTVRVSDFRPFMDKNHLMSYKIRKISLFCSLQFWSQVFFFDYRKRSKIGKMLSILEFFFNVCLVLLSIFFPVGSTVYVLFVKLADLCMSKCKKCKKCKQLMRWLFFIAGIAYLICTYIFSFNIFFNGISYLIQFFIFTFFLAVPRFPIETYIYVIFITSFILYISRFVSQFVELYKRLLETILTIQGRNEIQIKLFDKIVAKYFPVYNETFYLFIKILLCSLFFFIIFDTMQRIEYINFKQPDLATFISVIFLFGPPRLLEACLASDFTSRVHRKEKELKIYIETIDFQQDKQMSSEQVPNENISIKQNPNPHTPTESRETFDDPECCECITSKSRCFLVLQYILTFIFGCFQCSTDDEEDKCECCVMLNITHTDNRSDDPENTNLKQGLQINESKQENTEEKEIMADEIEDETHGTEEGEIKSHLISKTDKKVLGLKGQETMSDGSDEKGKKNHASDQIEELITVSDERVNMSHVSNKKVKMPHTESKKIPDESYGKDKIIEVTVIRIPSLWLSSKQVSKPDGSRKTAKAIKDSGSTKEQNKNIADDSKERRDTRGSPLGSHDDNEMMSMNKPETAKLNEKTLTEETRL